MSFSERSLIWRLETCWLRNQNGFLVLPELSALLVTNAGPSMGHFAMHITEPCPVGCLEPAEACLKTGEVPFERANGKTVYEFTQDNSWSGDVFINAMSFLTDHSVDALLDIYDFSRFDTVMMLVVVRED